MAVPGLGGMFFRVRDTEGLSTWYRDHLGIGAGCAADGAGPAEPSTWTTLRGPVVFVSFAADMPCFVADKASMLNLRVDDLEGMPEQLNAARTGIETRDEWDSPEVGRFARVDDPEGNAIESWEQS